MTIAPSALVAELVAEAPGTIAVFQRHQIEVATLTTLVADILFPKALRLVRPTDAPAQGGLLTILAGARVLTASAPGCVLFVLRSTP